MAAVMRSSLLRLAIAIVRAWTRVYTWRMPPALREARRAEIESDAWEFQQDAAHGRFKSPAAHMLIRLLAGIPDDLCWRIEQAAVDGPRVRRSIAIGAYAAGAVLFLVALWAIDADAARKRSGFAFAAPSVGVEQERLPLLTAGIVATVGASMMPRLAAQSAKSVRRGTPAFEAVSIKPNNSGSPLLGILPLPGGRFTATNVSLGLLIRNAYQLPIFRVSGGTDWIESDRFDVVATAGYDATQAQLRLMVQTLLAERFKLSVHTETREQPVYELVVARRDGRLGPNLRRSEVDCAGADWPSSFPGSASPRCGFIGSAPDVEISSGRSRFELRGTSMGGFARFLQGAVRRYVFDRTGLDGYFDGEFDFTVEMGPPPPPQGILDPYDRTSFPTIFTVVQEQLGLRLESTRGPVEILVIDSAQQPTAD
jgi:uncharacterized protein (TIGR03435 family)